MLTLNKIAKLAAGERFDVLLDEVCRNGRPRVGPAPSIGSTRDYATTPGALPLAALGLGLRRCIELSWTVEPSAVEMADAIGQRICQLAALRCRAGKQVKLPERLHEALGHSVTALAELVKHCEQTHAEVEDAAWGRLNAALQIGRYILQGEGVFMSPQRASQLGQRDATGNGNDRRDDSLAA